MKTPTTPTDADHEARRSASLRTAAILGSVALVFFGGIVVAQYAGSASVGIGVLGFAIIGLLAVSIGRKAPQVSAPVAASSVHSNRALLGKLCIVAAVMFVFGYAMIPFYYKICEVTGLRDIDLADKVVNTQVDVGRTVRIELDANLNKLPWRFRALTPIVSVHPGELTQVVYEVENTSEQPMTGQAIPSYGPRQAAEYFKKLECFCFTKQSFAAHERRQMPVVFVVDPKLPKDIATITLSYTFFEVEGNRS